MSHENADLASPRRRVAGYVLDAVISGVLISPFLLGMRLTGDWSGNHFDLTSFYAWGIPAWLLGMAVIVYLEGERGATPAKWLLGMRVVNAATGDGAIGWRRDLVRRLMFLPEGVPLYLGYLWMFWDRRHQAWHDKVARSIVVRTFAGTSG